MKTSLFSTALMALLIAVPVSAQCWECEMQYYPGDDCWMEGCSGNWEEGRYNNCSQSGSCDNEQCSTSGGICNPFFASMDGRAPGRIAPEMTLDELQGIFVRREAWGHSVALACSGVLMRSTYPVDIAQDLRNRSRRLTLS